jgi:arabinofuranosyltransferase
MLVDPARHLVRVRATTVRIASDPRRLTALVVLMVPVILVVIMGWQHRWTSDDGFINFRYVDQIRHGNGPVFNAGERIEAFTSPLWLALLVGFDLVLPLRLEWIAVFLGLALTAGGFGFAAAGAIRLWRHVVGEGSAVPAGLLVSAALPPVWDFATSGLDNALGVAWLGASWWALVRHFLPDAGRPERSTTTPWATCVLLGLGPLVRPDLGIMTVAFLGVLVLSEPSWRARGRVVAWALALPLAYEVFRMAYYATIVPNTALAKEAGASQWSRGWDYLVDFARPYRLWIPLALIVLVGFIPLLLAARRLRSRREVTLIAAPLAAGIAHAAYVIRVGGDFMHARMLLPSLFCLLLPVGVVVVRGWFWAVALVLVPWVLLSAAFVQHRGDILSVVNEREHYVRFSAQRNPVTIDDYVPGTTNLPWARAGFYARQRAARGERGLLLQPFTPSVQPLTLSERFVDTPVASRVPTLGIYGYAAGPDVFVVDSLGLATALGSRFTATQSPEAFGPGHDRAGHEKPHRDVWEVALFTPPAPGDSPELRAARHALRCGDFPELSDAVSGKFGPGRAWRNFRDSFTLTRLRLPEPPDEAERELCG